jgi:hypothetical protein
MAIPRAHVGWDAATEVRKWQRALEKGHEAQNSLGDQLSKSSPNFHLLCLAELDAGKQLLRPENFVSRTAFLDQLRRLITEPTTPSQPVPSLQAYRDSQKWWVESVIQAYEEIS